MIYINFQSESPLTARDAPFTRSKRVAWLSYEVYVKIGISHSCFCFRAIVVYMVKIVINLSTDNKRNMLIIARLVVSFHLTSATFGEIPVSSQIIRQRLFKFNFSQLRWQRSNVTSESDDSLTIAFVCGCVCIWRRKNYCISCGKVIFAQSLPCTGDRRTLQFFTFSGAQNCRRKDDFQSTALLFVLIRANKRTEKWKGISPVGRASRKMIV